ncbi:hypothetical protein, partial [Amycolatopsis sp. NPDC059021]|uniref:hypothetical protein n=1 Tax=Amycolatopsis sp. NPDC059021 TaxID=3346704 RepID=UPI0036703F68
SLRDPESLKEAPTDLSDHGVAGVFDKERSGIRSQIDGETTGPVAQEFLLLSYPEITTSQLTK